MAPRASLTPTTISAWLQSSTAPCGAAAGTPLKSNVESSFRSAWNTGTRNSERWRSSVVVFTTAEACAGNTMYVPWWADSAGVCGGIS